MKASLLALGLALTSLPATALAQAAPAVEESAMSDPFAWMDGRWRGPAMTMTEEGPLTLTQTERSGKMLGRKIRLVEGKGYRDDGSVGFNALGVIAATPEGGYELRSWTLDSAGTFPIETDGRSYVWNVPIAIGTVRYEGSFDGEKWRETGHLIRDGADPLLIFRMELTRIDDTDWPSAGPLTP